MKVSRRYRRNGFTKQFYHQHSTAVSNLLTVDRFMAAEKLGKVHDVRRQIPHGERLL